MPLGSNGFQPFNYTCCGIFAYRNLQFRIFAVFECARTLMTEYPQSNFHTGIAALNAIDGLTYQILGEQPLVSAFPIVHHTATSIE